MQSVPYWVDDESVRSSMVASAPLSPPILNNAEIENRKPRETFGLGGRAPVTHPLLGDQPTLQLIQEGRRSGNHGARPHNCMILYARDVSSAQASPSRAR